MKLLHKGFNCYDIYADGYLIGNVAPVIGNRWGAQSIAGFGCAASTRDEAAVALVALVRERGLLN